MPRTARHSLYRSLLSVNLNPPQQLRIKLATTQEELEAAFQLLHDAYVRATLMKPDPSGMRLTVYHALPSTSTIIALWEGKVVGTVSVIRNNPLGLPLDKIFRTETLKQNGSRVAEISSLAIAKNFNGPRIEVLFPMLKFLYEYCIHYFGVDYKLIAVNPRHIDFYEGVLCFEEIENRLVEKYDFVNGHPAYGRFLNLREAYARFAAIYGMREPNRNLFSYFTSVKLPNLEYPDRRFYKVSDPVMTPELLNYFFNEKTNIFRNLTDPEKVHLCLQYDLSKYRQVLPYSSVISQAQEAKREVRYDVRCEGRAVLPEGGRIVRLEMKNVSSHGFCAALSEPIRFGTLARISVAVGEFHVADLEAMPVWTEQNVLYGFVVKKASSQWQHFIDYLTKDQNRVAA